MLSLAGIPATAGFVGKLYLIQALVDGGYTWLAVVLVLGSVVSLGYYLRVVAAIWMRGPSGRVAVVAGGSGEAEAARLHWEVVAVAVVFGAASIFFGIVPQPLFDLVHGAGSALSGLL
jgi:NADH-quinone oxidoreductase subunit N